jgi:hypothetical protein
MFQLPVCLLAVLAASPQPARSETARAVVAGAMEAVGGEATLKAISTLQIEAIGHDYFIDQSERPEGPFVVRYLSTSEKRDVAGGRSRIETEQRYLEVPDWGGAGAATIVDADTAAIARGDRVLPAGVRRLTKDGSGSSWRRRGCCSPPRGPRSRTRA